MRVVRMIVDAKNPIGVTINFAGALALLEQRRHLEGSFVIELDVAVVEADTDDVSKRVVAQA